LTALAVGDSDRDALEELGETAGKGWSAIVLEEKRRKSLRFLPGGRRRSCVKSFEEALNDEDALAGDDPDSFAT
jgi:hypothetical protein